MNRSTIALVVVLLIVAAIFMSCSMTNNSGVQESHPTTAPKDTTALSEKNTVPTEALVEDDGVDVWYDDPSASTDNNSTQETQGRNTENSDPPQETQDRNTENSDPIQETQGDNTENSDPPQETQGDNTDNSDPTQKTQDDNTENSDPTQETQGDNTENSDPTQENQDSNRESSDQTIEMTPSETVPAAGLCSYEEYLDMTPAQQQSYYEQFESVDAFSAWFIAAKAEFDAYNGSIEIDGNGSVDLGDFMNGNDG